VLSQTAEYNNFTQSLLFEAIVPISFKLLGLTRLHRPFHAASVASFCLVFGLTMAAV